MHTTKAKTDAYLWNLVLSPLKQLKIQNKYTLNKYKHFICIYKLSLHTLGDIIISITLLIIRLNLLATAVNP